MENWSCSSDPFEKLGKITFIPVLFQVKPVKQLKKKDLTFWTKEGVFHYHTFLVNAHHHTKALKPAVMEMLNPDSIIFADSGGLQAVTLGSGKPDIKELTKWQESHSNIGFGFDELPFKSDIRKLTGWEFDRVNFPNFAKRSRENLDIALETRTNPNFKLYGIVQGRKYAEYQEWLDIIKGAGVDGYCVKSPSNNPINVAESALFAYYNLDKPVHFLGMSNLSKTLLLYYFSTYFKHKITFDSSTYNQGSQFRTYVHPSCPALKIRYVREDYEPATDKENVIIFEKVHDLSFCGCKACSFLTKEQFAALHEDNDPRLGPLITLHNFLGLDSMFNFAGQICHHHSAMVQFVRALFKPAMAARVIAAMEMIRDGVDKGYEYVGEKYKSLLSENVETVTQKTVFDF